MTVNSQKASHTLQGAFTPCARQGGVRRHMRLIRLKANQQVLLYHCERLPHATSKWVREPLRHMSLHDQELFYQGKSAFQQLTCGSSRVSGSCHQSDQCLSMLRASDYMQDNLWCRGQGILAQANNPLPHITHGVKAPLERLLWVFCCVMIKGLRPVLNGFVVTMHKGTCEQEVKFCSR